MEYEREEGEGGEKIKNRDFEARAHWIFAGERGGGRRGGRRKVNKIKYAISCNSLIFNEI